MTSPICNLEFEMCIDELPGRSRFLSLILIAVSVFAVSGCRSDGIWNRWLTAVPRSLPEIRPDGPGLFSRLPFVKQSDNSVVPPVPVVDSPASFLVERGKAALREQRLEDAEQAFSEALAGDAAAWEAHHGLAMIADLKQDWERSERHYKRALESQKDNPRLLSDVGYSYILQSRHAEADDYLHRSLEIDPDQQQAHLNLALLELKRGDPSASMKQINEVFPDSADALQVFNDLQEQMNGEFSRSPLSDPGTDLPADVQRIQDLVRRGRERAEAVQEIKELPAYGAIPPSRPDRASLRGTGGNDDRSDSTQAMYPGPNHAGIGDGSGFALEGPVEAPPAAVPLISEQSRESLPSDEKNAQVPVSSRRELESTDEVSSEEDGNVTQTGYQYYADNRRPNERRMPERDSRYRDDGRYERSPDYRDNRRYESDARDRDNRRYESDARDRDDGRYESNARDRDDGRYESNARYRDDRRYESDARDRDDRRYESDARYRDDRRYESDARDRDDGRYESDARYRDNGRYEGDARYRDDRRYESDARYRDDRRDELGRQDRNNSRPASDRGYPEQSRSSRASASREDDRFRYASSSVNEARGSRESLPPPRPAGDRLYSDAPPYPGDGHSVSDFRDLQQQLDNRSFDSGDRFDRSPETSVYSRPTQMRSAMPVYSGAGGVWQADPRTAPGGSYASGLTRPAQPAGTRQTPESELLQNRGQGAPAGYVNREVSGVPQGQINSNGINTGPGVLFPVGQSGTEAENTLRELQRIVESGETGSYSTVAPGSSVINGSGWPAPERLLPVEAAGRMMGGDGARLQQGPNGTRSMSPQGNPMDAYGRQLRGLQETYGGPPTRFQANNP
jgi:hypothetical protein